MSTREELLSRTFVELADTLVDDFDLEEFLAMLTERCVELFDVQAAGLMLVDAQGNLRLMASSSERMRLLEIFELQRQEGPCLDCYQTGEVVDEPDLASAGGRWPAFASEASRAGFVGATAVPMRLRRERIGVMNLFRVRSGPMEATDMLACRALADVATIGLLQHRAGNESRLLAEQLTYALNNRVTIEQAKGVLAERLGIPVDRAFAVLRAYARGWGLRLAQVAGQVVNGELTADELHRRRPSGGAGSKRPPAATGGTGLGRP